MHLSCGEVFNDAQVCLSHFVGVTLTKSYQVLSLYHNCDSTTIRLRRKIIDVYFLLASNWKQARAIGLRRSRIVVGS